MCVCINVCFFFLPSFLKGYRSSDCVRAPLPVPVREGAGACQELMKWTLTVFESGARNLSGDMCLLCERVSLRKKENTVSESWRERERKKMCGCWLVYRLCIDFSSSDTWIFHMEQSALLLPAFCPFELCTASTLSKPCENKVVANVK